MTIVNRVRCLFAAGLLCTSGASAAQDPQPAAPPVDPTALAKATQNPVGDLISLPFQFNFNTAGDLGDRSFLNLNFQPVIPFSLSSHWNLIARTVVPLNSVPGQDPNLRYSGAGDIQEQLYVTPKKAGPIIWGIGPVLSFPTATADPVRTGSWAAGPGGVVVSVRGPFVLGGLVNQFWTYADDDTDPTIDLFVVQPFVNYNFGKGWAIAFAPLMSANWDAAPGQKWTVPLGLGISRTTVLGARPMTLGVQYYYNVERPDGSGASLLRFSISLLYPQKPK